MNTTLRNAHALGVELVRLLAKADLIRANAFMQHGDTSCLVHCIAVAYVSMKLLEFLHLRYDRKSLLRGALLHDFFLYDWHTHRRAEGERMHAFSHPTHAWRNARARVKLNAREEDIILRHMFPVTLTPPKYRESVAVCIADKLCALHETLHPSCYAELKRIYAPAFKRAMHSDSSGGQNHEA
ncbi:MAG: hypothetical protein IJ074_02650 [Clostridia bacterium]|nr:hypothetical protein [Clostridia bacterium]MBQ8971964.1 hypothetical protein [Clostridia bacterium]